VGSQTPANSPREAEQILAQEARFLSPATRLPFLPLAVRAAAGSHLLDADGRRLLDLHSMAAITNTGHGHPRVVEAIQRQATTLVHCNSAYASHEPLARLAERLARLAPGRTPKRVAFGLSGSDANDGAIKLARAATGRPRLLAFEGAYHGNTYGALSLSAVDLRMRRGFGPELPGIHHIPYPDPYRMPGDEDSVSRACLAALDRLLETVAPPEEVAAVFFEPIQGDSGILVPPRSYVDGLVQRCAHHGILLVAEEVQTGIGRTGRWLASEHFELEPDVLILGKALGSGMPVSAIVARAELMEHWAAPGHVFCTGANPVCCAAALATLEVIEEEGLVENADRIGAHLREGLIALAERFDCIGDIRGLGLMLGVDLVKDRASKERARELAARVLVGCFARGVYLTFLAGSVLRIAPPLIITAQDADLALEAIEASLCDAVEGRVSDQEVAAITGW
jgi:4-aminobutyrate aminotransferase